MLLRLMDEMDKMEKMTPKKSSRSGSTFVNCFSRVSNTAQQMLLKLTDEKNKMGEGSKPQQQRHVEQSSDSESNSDFDAETSWW